MPDCCSRSDVVLGEILRFSETSGKDEECGGELPLQQSRQRNFNVGAVAVVECDPDILPVTDRVQRRQQGVGVDPHRSLPGL